MNVDGRTSCALGDGQEEEACQGGKEEAKREDEAQAQTQAAEEEEQRKEEASAPTPKNGGRWQRVSTLEKADRALRGPNRKGEAEAAAKPARRGVVLYEFVGDRHGEPRHASFFRGGAL